MISAASRIKRQINSAKRIWAELDYAQRRSLELQTGVPMGARERRSRVGGLDDLNRLRAA